MLSGVIRDVKTIEDVVATMRAIDGVLPDNDGLKWFNYLYLSVTEALSTETGWKDWPFLQQFDVVFASLYFEAVVNWERDETLTAHCWRPLLRSRYEAKPARIQFALAGMNAHINHDLAVALYRMAAAEGRFPSRDSERHIDFSRINDLLERTEATVRERLATGLVGEIDRSLGNLDSIVAMWNVRKAREAAWTNGEVLWHLRVTPLLQDDYRTKLDQMTAFAGQGLLLPPLGVRPSNA